jgi:hypothetical protein
VHSHFPLRAHSAVDLARPPFPVEVFAIPVAPQRININHCDGAIALLGNLNSLCSSSIMDKGVGVKQLLPYLFPALGVKSPQHQHPVHWIVSAGARRPGPNHVGLKDCDQQIDILRISGSRLSIHNLDNLFFNFSFGPHCRDSLDSTNSSSTPPVLEGCTNTYLCPPAPVLISSETRRTPSFLRRATAAGKSGTRRHT